MENKKEEIEKWMVVFLAVLVEVQAYRCSYDSCYASRNKGCGEILVVNDANDIDPPPWNLISGPIQMATTTASRTANASLSAVVDMSGSSVV